MSPQSATLRWDDADQVDAVIGDTPVDRRWADSDGNLTPGFDLVPGFPLLALVVDGQTALQGDVLVRDERGLHVRAAA